METPMLDMNAWAGVGVFWLLTVAGVFLGILLYRLGCWLIHRRGRRRVALDWQDLRGGLEMYLGEEDLELLDKVFEVLPRGLADSLIPVLGELEQEAYNWGYWGNE